MNQRLKVTLLILVSFGGGIQSWSQMSLKNRKPNVIVIYTDDQKWEQFGFIGKGAYTPNIDKLAKEGAYFSNAYASSSVCSPSRYSAVTGQYASRCSDPAFKKGGSAEGVTKVLWNVYVAPDDLTWPRIMQQNGYKTGMVGKWHIGSENWKPVRNGNINDPETVRILRLSQKLACESVKKRGFDYAAAVYRGNPDDDRNLKKNGWNLHCPEWYTKAALDFIELNKDEQFALYFCPTLMHSPSPMESLTKGDPRLTPIGMLDNPISGIMPSRKEIIEIAKKHNVPKQLIPVTWHDASIGAVMNKLDELGLTENTLILYFNDNGTDDNGKGSSYQGGTHVPFFVYMPGMVNPGERKQLASNIDIAPTIFDITGVNAPEEMTLDGKSLMPILRGEKVRNWRDVLYHEIGLTRAAITEDYKYIAFHVPPSYNARSLEDRQAEHKKIWSQMVKQHSWIKKHWSLDPEAQWMHMGMAPGGDFMERLQIYTGNAPFKENYYDPDQLYNIKKDPREKINLANNPEFAVKLKTMENKLSRLLKEVPGTYPELKEKE